MRINHRVCVTVAVIVSFVLCCVACFSQTSYMEKMGFNKFYPSLGTFVFYAAASYTVCLVAAVTLYLIGRKRCHKIACFVFIGIDVLSIYLLLVSFTYRKEIVDSIKPAFTDMDYQEVGYEFQEDHNCTGWDNISQPVEWTDPKFSKTCRSVLVDIYNSRVIPFRVMIGLSIAGNSYGIYGSVSLYRRLYLPGEFYMNVPV